MAAKDNLQPKLFDIPRDEPTPISMPLDETATYWHASQGAVLPAKDRGKDVPVHFNAEDEGMGHPEGIHSGTLDAAIERQRATILPVNISGSVAAISADVEDPSSAYDPILEVDHRFSGVHWSDAMANNSIRANKAIKAGKNVAYTNDVEDVGSVSMRSPRQNVRTWSESVIADPASASYAERSAVRKGAELTYGIDWSRSKNPKATGFPKDIQPPSALYGVVESEGGEMSIIPRMVYPHKKAKKSKTDTNQMRLDL